MTAGARRAGVAWASPRAAALAAAFATALASALVLALAMAPRLLPPWTLNHDAAWFLCAAGALLDGGRIGVDVADPNLPLVVYLSAIPASASRWCGLPIGLSFAAFVASMALASLALVSRLLAAAVPAGRRAPVVAALGLLLMAGPGADFGQREHLLAILALPYALAVGARRIPGGAVLPRWLAAAAGALAGLGFALKPAFLLAPLLAHVPLPRSGCRVRAATPENATLGAVLAAYAAHFALLPADCRAGLRDAMAAAWATYSGYDCTVSALVTSPWLWQCALLLAASALAPPGPERALDAACARVAVALAVVALAQGKGFPYHGLGAWTFAFAAFVLAGAAALPVLRPATRAAVALAVLGLAALTAAERDPASGALRWQKAGRAELARAQSLRQRAAEARRNGERGGERGGVQGGEQGEERGGEQGGERDTREQTAEVSASVTVLALDTELTPHFPAVALAGQRWSLRLSCLWPLPGAYGDAAQDAASFRYHALDAQPPAERWLRATLRDDVRRRPPALVAVRRPPLAFVADARFDPLDWLVLDPELAAWWRDYDLVDLAAGVAWYRRR